jgi:hypothetical protein
MTLFSKVGFAHLENISPLRLYKVSLLLLVQVMMNFPFVDKSIPGKYRVKMNVGN